MTVEYDEVLAGQGGTSGVTAEEEMFDFWNMYSTAPLEAPVVTHTETTVHAPPMGVGLIPPPTETTIVDLRVVDIWNQYGNATPEGQRQINERLYAAGFYGNKNPEAMDDLTDSYQALNQAISVYATKGVSALDALPLADPSALQPAAGPARIIRRATEAQVYSMADSAAKNLLGRNASSDERQLAMSVIRALETSQSQSPSGADVEAAFASAAPGEVSARATEKTLSVFERLVRGA